MNSIPLRFFSQILALTTMACFILACAGDINFKELEYRLTARLKNNDNPEENMKQVFGLLDDYKKRLAELPKKSKPNAFSKVADRIIKSKNERDEDKVILYLNEGFESFIRELNLFISLDKLNTEEVRCTEKAYEILKSVEEASKGGARDMQSSRRVDKLIAYHFMNHANYCQNKYIKIWTEKREKLEDSEIEAFEYIASKVLPSLLQLDDESIDSEPFELSVFVPDEMSNNWSSDDTLNAMYAIGKIASVKIGSNLDRKTVRRLIEQYLLRPCDEYVDKLAFIFKLAEFDKITKFTKSEKYDMKSNGQFYFSWAAVNMCELALDRGISMLINDFFTQIN